MKKLKEFKEGEMFEYNKTQYVVLRKITTFLHHHLIGFECICLNNIIMRFDLMSCNFVGQKKKFIFQDLCFEEDTKVEQLYLISSSDLRMIEEKLNERSRQTNTKRH